MITTRSVAAFALLAVAAAGADPCGKLLRTKVENGTLIEDGGLRAQDGVVYSKGAFWKDGDAWWACPCLGDKPCFRVCKKSLVKKVFKNEPFEEEISRKMKITIWENNSSREVQLMDHFAIIRESVCNNALHLEPDLYPTDEYITLANGSIQFTSELVEAKEQVPYNPEVICFTRYNDSLRAFTCNFDLPPEDYRFYLYPPFFILSAICLALTLLAYQVNQDSKSLHNRAIFCQSAALFFTYVGLSINYLTGKTSHIHICVALTYTNYFFLMASFFWLNVMCVDIFLTFRSLTRVRGPKYLQASLYAWGVPFLFLVVTVIMDQTTDQPFSPRIGRKSCWFNDFLAEFIYFHGPVMVLLLINLVLFGLTAYHLWVMRSESNRVLQTPESGVHANAANRERLNNDRFVLFIKLFLLMGCTWLMEIISWAVGGDKSYWYLTDIINCTRGVLMFWFCVWSKKPVRDSLFRKLTSVCKCIKKEDKNSSAQNSTEVHTNDTPLSGSSATLELENTK
ncbi:G-protein coupled receptor Mth2-like [Cloeon dipterum]|uniref:G-protein coupled receptor Mth2-like n=1 Tax=Cloeon dipterum TaxID=197152 RepID=UPI00321FF839